MDQIDIAKIIAYLMILPPENAFCRLVKDFAESGQHQDLSIAEESWLVDREIATRLTEAAWEIEEDMEEWERHCPPGFSLMEITQKIVSSPAIISHYNRRPWS